MKSIWKQDKDDGRWLKKGHYYYHDKGLLIDLTLVFGKGNEPIDINDDRLKVLEVYK